MENQNEDRPTFSENYEKKIGEIVRKYYNKEDADLILQGRKQAKDELKEKYDGNLKWILPEN